MRRAATAVVVLVLALTACGGGDDDESTPTTVRSTVPETQAPTTTPTSTSTTLAPFRFLVGAVGDSNLAQVRDALPVALPELDVAVEGIVGLTANDAEPAVERVLARSPVAVVVVLGTNDARDGRTAGDDVEAVRDIARRLRQVPCVRWVTVNESSRYPELNEGARAINDELRRQAEARPGFELVPWGAAVAEHPSWLLEDGIHHSVEGQAVFTDRLAAALRGCVAALGTAAVG